MGLKKLVTDLTTGLKAYPNHNTPSTSGGFNYGGSTSVFDSKQFNQRSLKYDQGKASEHQQNPTPYVVTDLPGVNDERSHVGPLSGLFNNPIGNFIDGISDGFVRGGLQFATRRSLEDTKRIGKFFISANGLGFVANQVALQRTNPIIQETAGDGLISKIGDFLQGAIGTDLGIGNINRTYSPLNTLAQIPISATGKHLDRAGLLPVRPEKGKYQYVAFESGDSHTGTSAYDSGGNRLLFLGQQTGMFSIMKDNDSDGVPNFLDPDSAGPLASIGPQGKPSPLSKIGGFVTKAKNAISGGMDKIKAALGLPSSADLPPVLYEYPGGPGSLYGVGSTTIRRYTNTKSAIDPNTGQLRTVGALISYTNSYLKDKRGRGAYIQRKTPAPPAGAGTPSGLGSLIPPLPSMHPQVKSFGDVNGEYRSAYISKFVDDKHTVGRPIRREQRFQTGDPGTLRPFWNDNGIVDVTTNNNLSTDMINALDIIKTGDGSELSLDHSNLKDMVRFHIEAINTDNPLQAETMVFRAFLDDWSDDYSGNWNSLKYNGRGEEFYTYDGFKRTTSFSFKVAAQTRWELKPLYRKLNYLVSQTAPDYKDMRMRGNYVKISIGDLMDRTPGIITGVSLKWQKDYPWEIAIDGGDFEMLQLPHCLDVSVKFTPIHSFVPQKGKRDANGNLKELSPFILPSMINGSEHIDESRDWTTKGAADSFDSALPDPGRGTQTSQDPSGRAQGENNIPQTGDAAKASEHQSNQSTTANTPADQNNTGTPTNIPVTTADEQNTNPQQDPSGNPTGDVDTSSEKAAEEVIVADANTSTEPALPADGSDWDQYPHTNNQPNPKYPGGVTFNQFFGRTRSNPTGYSKGEIIYNTDNRTCGTTKAHAFAEGNPPVARAIANWRDENGNMQSNWLFASGVEQSDPTYGALSITWYWDNENGVDQGQSVTGLSNNDLIFGYIEAKGQLHIDNIHLGSAICGYAENDDFEIDEAQFNYNTNVYNQHISMPQSSWAGGRKAFAEALLKIAEEKGIEQLGCDYSIERR